MENMALQVEAGTTKIYGFGTNAQLVEETDAAGVRRLTFPETVFRISKALMSPNKESSKKINDFLRGKFLFTNTGVLYLPNNSAYTLHNPEMKDGWPVMNEEDLKQRLESSDPSVGYAEDCEFGQMKSEYLVNTSLVRALAEDNTSAKLVGALSDAFSTDPFAFGPRIVSKPQVRVASLDLDYYGYRLYVGGDCGLYRDGYVLGELLPKE